MLVAEAGCGVSMAGNERTANYFRVLLIEVDGAGCCF